MDNPAAAPIEDRYDFATAALIRISGMEAFVQATAHVDPETIARVEFARGVLELLEVPHPATPGDNFPEVEQIMRIFRNNELPEAFRLISELDPDRPPKLPPAEPDREIADDYDFFTELGKKVIADPWAVRLVVVFLIVLAASMFGLF